VRGCDGWGRTSILRVTTGRPAVERRRIVHMDAPARLERARVGSKPTALSPLSYGAVTEAAGFEPAGGVAATR
jgi:hypothetical protein